MRTVGFVRVFVIRDGTTNKVVPVVVRMRLGFINAGTSPVS